MRNNPCLKSKNILNLIGFLLGLTGIIFVGMKLWAYFGDIDFRSLSVVDISLLSSLAICYGLSGFVLAIGWRCLLKHLGADVTLGWSVWAYGISQLAKYVPGNVFHLAGRQAIGAGAGISHRILVKSSIGEILLIVIAAIFFIFSFLPSLIPFVTGYQALTLFAVLFICTLYGISHWGNKILAEAFILYFLFLVLSGLAFVGVYLVLRPSGISPSLVILPLLSAYIVAWLAGLLTPGAPAGLGVREAVLLFLLNGLANEEVLLLSVVIGRMVTVLGDLFYYLYAALFAQKLLQNTLQGAVKPHTPNRHLS